MKLISLFAFAAVAFAAPTNDVTLFTRALFQNCTDENGDYLAVDFLEGSEKTIASHKATRDFTRNSISTFSQHNIVYFSSRTNYIDGKVAEWTKGGSFEQVVIVAAGFDSRAYRMPLDVKFFEVDFPAVVADKQKRVKENNLTCAGKSVSYVGADLRTTTLESALKATAGFDASKKTVYVVEGLIYYLHQDAVDTLFKSIGQVAAPGSNLVFDYANLCIVKEDCKDLAAWEIKLFLEIMRVKKEPWFSGFRKNGTVVPWLKQWGFEPTQMLSFQTAGEPPLSVKTWTNSTIFGQMNFLTAVKK